MNKSQNLDLFIHSDEMHQLSLLMERNDRFPPTLSYTSTSEIAHPFLSLRPEKRYPFRAEPPHIGHYREYLCGGWLKLLLKILPLLNPLNPKSDQNQISPCNINAL